ncbi:conserved hypothetical protein [Histoplasma capsulatum var. duboisii H88]|uniref:RING-type domain-containing protein n=1 Tax=Ajellomyces capsulatus (strain H88) TaxID=544711 RepID=F0U9P7_AJEC8|nr:conserved hypothetical protein [Histoplasma capsulatum var. duboisii H88]QSS51644.1 hypothetical protein I7I53_07012 [Histoplasma capsulatum var. duboisii H88]
MAPLSLSVNPTTREEIGNFSDTSSLSSLSSTPTLPPDSDLLPGPSTVNQMDVVHNKLIIEQALNENGQKHKGKGKEPNKIRLPSVPMSRYTQMSVAKYITNNHSNAAYYRVFGVIRGSSEYQLAANAKVTEMIVNHNMNDLNREQQKIVQSARKKWKAAFNKAKQDHPEMLNAFKKMEVSPLWSVTDYHKILHTRALPFLQELCNARDENDKFLNIANMRIDSSPPQHLVENIDRIHDINNLLDTLNLQNGVYSEAGKIPLEALEEQWELTINNNESDNLCGLVKDFQLPAAFLSVPPSDLLYYEDQDEEHNYYQSHWTSLTPHVEALMQSYLTKDNVPLAKSMFINHANNMNERIRRENTKRGRVEYLHLLDPDYLFSRLEAIAAKYHNGDTAGYDDMRTKMLADTEDAGMPRDWCPAPWSGDTTMPDLPESPATADPPSRAVSPPATADPPLSSSTEAVPPPATADPPLSSSTRAVPPPATADPSLPSFTRAVPPPASPGSTRECPICREPESGVLFSCMECSQRFHQNCLEQWARNSNSMPSAPTCPHCRSLRGYERIVINDIPTQESTTNRPSNTTNQPSRGRRPHHVPIPTSRVVRSIRPGYASNGERVVSAQVYGTTGRCVTRDGAGNYYLRTAAEAGGRSVIEAALRHGVPTIESQGWKSLRPNLANMGEYGIEWVASAEWDKFSRRLPNIVIGFFHHHQGRYHLVVGSRSSVAELLSIRVVDRLIAEAMGQDDLTLEEIFENAYGVTHHEREQHWRNNPCIRCRPVRTARR